MRHGRSNSGIAGNVITGGAGGLPETCREHPEVAEMIVISPPFILLWSVIQGKAAPIDASHHLSATRGWRNL